MYLSELAEPDSRPTAVRGMVPAFELAQLPKMLPRPCGPALLASASSSPATGWGSGDGESSGCLALEQSAIAVQPAKPEGALTRATMATGR